MSGDAKPPIKLAMVFGLLQVAAFDANGQQIPELQINLPALFAAHCEKCGYDPEGVIIETANGNKIKLRRSPKSWGGWTADIL